MVGVSALLNASWKSYQNLIWQNKANMEARRALDDICEVIRMSGNEPPTNTTLPYGYPQIRPDFVGTGFSYEIVVDVDQHGINTTNYVYAAQTAADGINYLVRMWNNSRIESVAQFVDSVTFEYEYRQPDTSGGTTWQMHRVSKLEDFVNNGDLSIFHLIKTVYVTVNVRIPKNITGADKEYTRTLTSAVTLRGPYDDPAPPAQAYFPP